MNERVRIFLDIDNERARQDEKHGDTRDAGDLPDVDPIIPVAARPKFVLEWHKVVDVYTARELYKRAFAHKRGSWAHILVEEFSEAIEAAGKRNRAELRAELVQVAAVCVAWIEAIDRRE